VDAHERADAGLSGDLLDAAPVQAVDGPISSIAKSFG